MTSSIRSRSTSKRRNTPRSSNVIVHGIKSIKDTVSEVNDASGGILGMFAPFIAQKGYKYIKKKRTENHFLKQIAQSYDEQKRSAEDTNNPFNETENQVSLMAFNLAYKEISGDYYDKIDNTFSKEKLLNNGRPKSLTITDSGQSLNSIENEVLNKTREILKDHGEYLKRLENDKKILTSFGKSRKSRKSKRSRKSCKLRKSRKSKRSRKSRKSRKSKRSRKTKRRSLR